jgi:hypothetical protein
MGRLKRMVTSDGLTETDDLVDDQLFHAFGGVLRLEAEVELVLDIDLVLGIVPDFQIRMAERLVAGDPL